MQIHFEKGLVVRTPHKMKIHKIENFLVKKQNWIINKLQYLEKNTPKKIRRDFSLGEKMLFLNEEYIIKHIPNDRKRLSIKVEKKSFEIYHPEGYNFNLNSKAVKNKIIRWYKDAADEIIKERVSIYKARLNVEPLGITIRSYKSRWGACRENGQITFNWKLIQAPIYIIDYVVVHELCHLVYLNHSKMYWKLVESIFPDYRTYKNWLKKKILHLRFE